MTLNNIVFLASAKGHVLTTTINGTLIETMVLNGTSGGEEGTFFPIATPAVAGYRVYVLTVFLPFGKEDQKITSNGQHRLYAIDIEFSSEHSMRIAFFMDLDPINPRQSSYREKSEAENYVVNFDQSETAAEDGKGGMKRSVPIEILEPRVMCTNELDRVFVSIPEVSTVGVLYGIKDNGFGRNGSLIFKRSLALAKMSMSLTSTDAAHGVITQNGNDRFRSLGTKVQPQTGTIWGLQGDKEVIVEIDSETGSILSTRNISEIVAARMRITSEIMVVDNGEKNDKQSLVFGMSMKTNFTVPTPRFYELCEQMGVVNNASSYLVQLKGDSLSWMINTPKEGMEIKGQIAGINNSENDANGPGVKDMLVVFAGNATRSTVFSVF